MTDQTSRPAGADDHSRQARGDRRRQQILDAAVELFSAKGYRGTGVAELAARVGMTATGLLYYFGSKERLLQEVVAERTRTDPSPAGYHDVRLADLRNMGDFNSIRVLTRLYIVLAIENVDPDSALHEFFVDRYELSRMFFARLVRAEQARGEVRAEVDADEIGREILSFVLGLEVQWLMDPDRIDLGTAMRRYIDRLVEQLAEEQA